MIYPLTREWVTSTIIGVTKTEQIKDAMLALNVPMFDDVDKRILDIYFK